MMHGNTVRQAASEAPAPEASWHAIPAEEALRRLESVPAGLEAGEAARRLAAHGPNRLPEARPPSALRRFLAQFANLLIYVLLGSAAITAALGHWLDAAVILGVVLINAVIGFVQEGRAAEALAAIRGMLTPHASVLRDGRRRTVDAAELVPGDLVLLEPGDKVPADLRLIRARGLRVEEAALTGESVPVEKSDAPVAADAPLGDRAGMAFSGTLVATGQATGVVVATGAATELGRISALLGAVETLATPLLQQIDRFAQRLTVVILGLSAAVFAFAWLARGYTADEAFMTVVGIAVAAVPEGLPAVLTITLAIGVRRMAARNAIIRRLPAVETLGSVSVICSDKTGTLTRNEMAVASVVTAAGTFEAAGAGYAPQGTVTAAAGREASPQARALLADLARAAALCNDAALREAPEAGWVVDGDPMEGALVAFAARAGTDPEASRRAFPRLDEIPFDARHRYMATLHQDGAQGGAFLVVKGAPERLLALCERERHGAGPASDVPINRVAWQAHMERLAAQGQRLLALATCPMPPGTGTLGSGGLKGEGLVLLGLLGLIDPPREEAVAAVAECQAAGIRVKMITGDHAATAAAIARQVGLQGAGVAVTGQELEALDDAGLRARARETSVFARTSPEHKLRLVEALQAEGEVVAMTGDGVNDAPALKRAEVGVAMGRKGTEAAKEAAEMVLADDNFATIAAAVREGRTVYDNLRKVIAWTLPTNGGEAVTIIAALLLGVTLPLTPLQILWINMVTATTLGLTLAFEAAEPNVMRRPPRDPREPLLTGFLVWRTVLVSVLFTLAAFGIFAWTQARGLPLEAARTAVVNTLVVLEIAYLFSVRYQSTTSLTWRGMLGTPAVLLGVGIIVVLQLAFTYLPVLQALFATRPLDPVADGLPILGSGIVLLVLLEAEKHIRRRLAARRM
ncbi:HAD-IC family P-type ATPase [Roseomonas sp. E05]|uniref:HAD-IC family P-type ATPase n=1 Tax=Roseomonas sp. E05 TaxID=3046310 RepID=UPI0024B89D06|nr:HAD-IC family P-type ATPase [Roseomonas sp. E05]MDJ0388434.1 HAD-IC family P-type ATPase [Roseomonas sp. E05]